MKIRFLNSIFLSIILILFVFHLPFVAAKDIQISANELNSLNPTSTLVSNNGNFTLGFFTISSTSTIDFTYLGIWYTNDEQDTKVWVANRDTPMFGNGKIKIDGSGTLKVVDGDGTTLFDIFNNLHSGSGNNTNTKAMLQDSGNFALYDEENRILWQSFDHPTDTLLPGMKIGYNLITKQNWTLTSSLSDNVPALGAFTLRLEQYHNSPQLLIYRRGEFYWASGPWNNTIGTFKFLDLDISFQYPYALNSDPSGVYLTVQTIGSASSKLMLSPNGQFIDDTNTNLSTPNFCYGYQSDNGCTVSKTMPNCRDQFRIDISSSGLGSSDYDDNSSIGLGDCMKRCWNDCKCIGFTTFNNNGTGCITWPGQQMTYNEYTQTAQKYIFVSHKHAKKKTWKRTIASLASVFTSLLLAAALVSVMIKRRRLKAKEKRRMRDDLIHQLTGTKSFSYGDELQKDIKDAPNIKIFSFKAILTATDNFAIENKLGQGGYGPVYKGKLFDGREIAIKRLSKTSGQGIREFKSELILISKLQHKYLVRLYGCCFHQEEKMLIYEFMPNKSLDFFLFVEDEKKKINWHIRFNIIEGVAQGLLYLHKFSRMKVIHRDLKVSNVLLDENMNPKIADFGMARIFEQDVTEAVTDRVVGTYGYMAPEYAMNGTFSIKTDVFSFGVLVLEIISGKKNSSFYHPERPLNLLGHVWELWNEQATLELKDKALGDSFDVKQLLRAIHVGLLCVQENAHDRPTMSKVIYMLNNETIDLPEPKKPAFFIGKRAVVTRTTDYLLDKHIPFSENSFTNTTMEAR